MPWAPVNGIDLYYESHGEGDAIVFAHGAGGNHLSWWQQVPYFRDRYRCVAFDHRGFGRSVEREDGPGGASFAEDLRALLDNLGIERTFLAAQSMGGRACLGFSLAYPERVRGLVMSDTTGTIDDPELARMRRALRGDESGPVRLEGRYYAPGFVERRPDLAFLYEQIRMLNPPYEQTSAVSAKPPDARYVGTREKLAALSLPVLFVVGESDQLVSPEIIRYAASLIPGARVFEAAGCGHSVYFEDAPTWNRVAAEFFAAVAAGGSK